MVNIEMNTNDGWFDGGLDCTADQHLCCHPIVRTLSLLSKLDNLGLISLLAHPPGEVLSIWRITSKSFRFRSKLLAYCGCTAWYMSNLVFSCGGSFKKFLEQFLGLFVTILFEYHNNGLTSPIKHGPNYYLKKKVKQ